ncbi:Hypothetical predicted protein [Olea europaea subsp. europaea]|uniref:DUF1985 domain-containing protein n=1 Tax=Olea europaea subsp. europaea TaxID=158383 RepID=A0A8S0RJA1_OLEEU|nr:Hypothetical predicted protein [Olea europaea subsp. europaea]
MDVEDIVNVKISNRCKMKLIDEVFYNLDDKYQDLFTNSCFGHLLILRNIKLASQLVHQLILRSISTSKENEVFIKVGDKLARFGLQEFTLVTRLKVGDLENEDLKLRQNCRLVKELFKCSNGKIKRGLLLQVFKRCKHKNDKYKLGLLIILMYVLLAAEENTFVNPWLFYLVDDLDRFNNYSWGRKSYEYTIKVFKRNLGDILKGYTTSQRYPYSLDGFPLAIMMEVHCMLNPTDDELLEPFWKEFRPFDDEADPKLDNVASKDEGEKESQSNQQNKEARERDAVIIEECSHEEVTSKKQPEAFPTYDDGFVPDPSSAIVLYQQWPLVWTGETFRTEEARQDDVTKKVARTKEDSNISNKDDYEKPSASSHVCQPSNEIIVIEDPNFELAVRRGH